ncbi:hypothetical protein RRG08_055666 [Elysia crispata]|uniref:Uncharacterized protein n=1 Tax=Elysia crispata TaxID=231223 RepID=A0AAE0Z9I6_9GAST|nr:hypothetical protein RRG08_055666 [Elysia crispata]
MGAVRHLSVDRKHGLRLTTETRDGRLNKATHHLSTSMPGSTAHLLLFLSKVLSETPLFKFPCPRRVIDPKIPDGVLPITIKGSARRSMSLHTGYFWFEEATGCSHHSAPEGLCRNLCVSDTVTLIAFVSFVPHKIPNQPSGLTVVGHPG